MMEVVKNLAELVQGVRRILESDGYRVGEKSPVEYFFRGESRNYAKPRSRLLDPSFSCALDRYPEWIANERKLYEDALRYNIASFAEDKTMVERLARMQHYQMPTRFADISDNAFLATHFACDSSSFDCRDKDNGEDGFIRIIKVHPKKMKSFTSDIIVSIAHLPLVDAKNIHMSKQGLGYLRYEVQNERAGFYDLEDDVDPSEGLVSEIQQVWAFRPILNTQRVRNQGGAFLAFGCRDEKTALNPSFSLTDYNDRSKPSWGIAQVGYLCIPADCKKRIRAELEHFGMRPEIAYPELSNVCSALSERYLGHN